MASKIMEGHSSPHYLNSLQLIHQLTDFDKSLFECQDHGDANFHKTRTKIVHKNVSQGSN